jgi:hypothetical protein
MDVYAANWNEADANNNTAAPDGAPEGMAASGVNDTMRAMMGATKRYVNQQSPKTTAGTSTAYTLAYGTAPGALVDGMKHVVCFNAANGDAPTLNVNSLGATPLHYFSAGSWTAVCLRASGRRMQSSPSTTTAQPAPIASPIYPTARANWCPSLAPQPRLARCSASGRQFLALHTSACSRRSARPTA